MPACSVLISSTQIYLGLYDGSLTCHCHFKKGGSLGRKQRDERKKNNPFVGLRARLFCRQQRDTKLLTSADVSSPTTRWSAWLGTLHWFTWGDGALLICFFPIFCRYAVSKDTVNIAVWGAHVCSDKRYTREWVYVKNIKFSCFVAVRRECLVLLNS